VGWATRSHCRKSAATGNSATRTLQGPYIKIGQALSTRPDLVPPHTWKNWLQDQLPPFLTVAHQFIEEELVITDKSTPNYRCQCSRLPRAQVYRGKKPVKQSPSSSAPGLERITIDLYVLRQLAAWANKNIKRVRSDLVAILDEFGGRLFEEMDYIQEGENAERFAQLYGHLKDVAESTGNIPNVVS